MGFDRLAFIEKRKYQPTEDQKVRAYRPTIPGTWETVKFPDDKVVGVKGVQ